MCGAVTGDVLKNAGGLGFAKKTGGEVIEGVAPANDHKGGK